MAGVTKDRFRSPDKRHLEKIDLSQWLGEGDFVWCQKLSAKDIVEMRREQGAEPELGNMAFLYDLLHRSLVDDSGTPLFESVNDAIDNFALPADCLEHIANECLRISKIGTTEKNSSPQSVTTTPSASS